MYFTVSGFPLEIQRLINDDTYVLIDRIQMHYHQQHITKRTFEHVSIDQTLYLAQIHFRTSI